MSGKKSFFNEEEVRREAGNLFHAIGVRLGETGYDLRDQGRIVEELLKQMESAQSYARLYFEKNASEDSDA